ncbi:hypothetical protein GCM10010172_42640 [Paractinoplanes ferrugineus]|uniref:Uncharacterized protein n=1 Tax=Paractinoplanes ferrugineus TaxID=113564 RepID=A0A919J4W3_9ACTN|nr:hypothetical protein [Actinoplanes ferrugineus]GIE13422.1 hypothetical protein Afe05nite_52620 [Actinoplanes ferrugineus]
MRNADFYEVTAQVIPTIFIAVVLELRALLGFTSNRWETAASENVHDPVERKLYGQYATAAYLFLFSAIGFVVSELAALSVVLFGVNGFWPCIAVFVVAVGVAMLTVVAFGAPLWHDALRSKVGNPR